MDAKTLSLQCGYRCETGAVRDRNEDSCLMITSTFGGHFDLPTLGLYVVADGMGGHTEGHVASNTAARVFAEFVLSHLYFTLLRQRPLPKEADILDTLERAVFAAHDAVYQPEPERNGGTTLTAALVLGHRAYVAHVGDSRAYVQEGDQLRLLTEDHSLARRLQDAGQLSPEDAETYPYRHVLLQALGQESALTADTLALDLPDNCKLLLCSDGLYGSVSQEQLAAALCGEGTLQDAADRLYEAAMTAGGPDNITAAVVGYA